MGTYDTRGGSPISPEMPDETCDFCERDPSDCECDAEVLDNARTRRAFMLAMRDLPYTAVVRAVNSLGIGINFTGCTKGSIADCWGNEPPLYHHAHNRAHWKPIHTLAYIRRKAIQGMTPLEKYRRGDRS